MFEYAAGIAGGSLLELLSTSKEVCDKPAQITYAKYLQSCHGFAEYVKFVSARDPEDKFDILKKHSALWFSRMHPAAVNGKCSLRNCDFTVAGRPFMSCVFPLTTPRRVKRSTIPHVKVIFGRSFPAAIRCTHQMWRDLIPTVAALFPWIKVVKVGTVRETSCGRLLPGELEISQDGV